MSQQDNQSTFVVVTGNPQVGQGQRLSQIRSRNAKKHHERRIARYNGSHSVHKKNTPVRRSIHAAFEKTPQELDTNFKPPPLASSPTGCMRMRRFMSEYVLYSHKLHPFFSTVVCAAVSHPVLMSAKILNASAWDDLMAHDRIESLTFEQSMITRYLLAQAMHSRDNSREVKLAALVAILLFDMVAEDSSSFERDERVLQLFSSAYGGIDSEGLGFAGHLKNSLILIEELKRCLNIKSRPPYVSETNNFPSQALDLSVFTLETHRSTIGAYENSPPMMSVLSDLYQLVMALRGRYHLDLTTVVESDQHSTPWMVHFQQPMIDSTNEAYPQNDARIAALLHASQILTWRGTSTQFLSLNACHSSHLKALLLNTDLDGFWDSLPGALIWCLVIGVRCSPPGPLRQWFMMQTTRVTCTMTINSSETVLRSLRVLLAGMDGAGG